MLKEAPGTAGGDRGDSEDVARSASSLQDVHQNSANLKALGRYLPWRERQNPGGVRC